MANGLPTYGKKIKINIKQLENTIGRSFGSNNTPLLLSVRSGARISMPGMMDTILNLGINDDIVGGISQMMGDDRPAHDAYRRLLQKYAEVVMDIPAHHFEDILTNNKAIAGIQLDHELSTTDLKTIINEFKDLIRDKTSMDVPADPWIQLRGAVEAVFKSCE